MTQRAAARDDVCGPLGTPGGVAPELNAATDEQVGVALRITGLMVSLPRWGELASDAHALWAAHYLATTPGLGLAPGSGAVEQGAGPLTSEADGPASRSFGQWSHESLEGTDAMLAQTSYGQKLIQLRRAQQGRGIFMTSGRTASAWR